MKIQILKKIFVIGFLLLSAFAQAQTVSGTVSDRDGIPLPGVSVVIKNTTKGGSTDFDGNFVLQNVEMGGTIVFSYVGFTTQEIVVNNFESLTIVMQEDMESLDEIVVVGYGTQKKA